MSPRQCDTTIAGRYDHALAYGRERNLPPDAPRPHPTKDWPPENVALLERYAAWLSGGGASEAVIRNIYIPMAGHVLGFNLKPHAEIDTEHDLSSAMDYVRAKRPGPDWMDVCRISLEKFRRFLLNDRGQTVLKHTPYNLAPHLQELPDWLGEELQRYLAICQRNWREARLDIGISHFWYKHLRIWRFLCGECGVREVADLKRAYLNRYLEYRLSTGISVKTVNNELRSLHGFLSYLQQQEYPVPQAALRSPCLKEPEALPRFLPDEQVCTLRDDFELRVTQAVFPSQRRQALLDRACFYLLWQAGLRRGEVEELRLEDLDLPGKRITVRRGKGLKDRTVYLTETTSRALAEYLPVRGMGPSDHVFLYRNQALSKDLIHGRLKLAAARTGVNVSAHRLRHTCATQLLNAGCRVTSIQKLLGHKKLNSTMIYARVHDQAVADDYYAAMQGIERRLALTDEPVALPLAIPESERVRLLALAEQLAQPEVSTELRLDLARQFKLALNGETLAYTAVKYAVHPLSLLDLSLP